jgi:hypothetical protein
MGLPDPDRLYGLPITQDHSIMYMLDPATAVSAENLGVV